MLGNLIQQGPASENSTIISYGAEGYRWPENRLEMAFNTIINDRTSGGTFLRVAKGARRVALVNNVLIGKGNLSVDAPLESRGNVEASRKEFSDPDSLDYRPRKASRLSARRVSAEPTRRTSCFRCASTHTRLPVARSKPLVADTTVTRGVPDDCALVHDALRGPPSEQSGIGRRVAPFWLVRRA